MGRSATPVSCATQKGRWSSTELCLRAFWQGVAKARSGAQRPCTARTYIERNREGRGKRDSTGGEGVRHSRTRVRAWAGARRGWTGGRSNGAEDALWVPSYFDVRARLRGVHSRMRQTAADHGFGLGLGSSPGLYPCAHQDPVGRSRLTPVGVNTAPSAPLGQRTMFGRRGVGSWVSQCLASAVRSGVGGGDIWMA